MNVYDFDNTIYDGESIYDFFLFCLKKKPQLIKFFPLVISSLIKYKLCLISSEELTKKAEKYISLFFSSFDAIDDLISEFWDKHIHKIKIFYLLNHKDDDIVISASWNELIKEACRRINISEVIASELDKDNFKINTLCYREKKVELFQKKYNHKSIDNFYTDSKNDLPMMLISKNSYLVKGEKIKKFKKRGNNYEL